MMRSAVLTLLLCLMAPLAIAQPEEQNLDALRLSVATGQAVYAEGEPIDIRITIDNPSDRQAITWASSCQVWFKLGTYDLQEHQPCTAFEGPVYWPAYSSTTYIYTLDPAELGLPLTSGVHQLVGYGIVGEPDTTTFEAPASTSGRVWFSAVRGVSHADLATLRDSLSAEVLYEDGSPDRGVYGQWRVSGAPLDTLVARRQSDPRFDSFEADRMWNEPPVIVSDDDPPAVDRIGLSVARNPVRDAVELVRSGSGVATVEVFDARGRRIAEEAWGGDARSLRLTTSGWSAGVYTARVQTRDASSTVRFTVVR